MKTLRYILSFPAAFGLSLITWIFGDAISPASTCGGGFFRSIVGVSPLVIVCAISAIIFSLVGVLVSPNQKRKSAFIFFGLSLVFSGGGFECDRFVQIGNLQFWIASFSGIILGGFSGLFFTLKIQKKRKTTEPNQSPEPTAMAVTPPAAQEARQP